MTGLLMCDTHIEIYMQIYEIIADVSSFPVAQFHLKC